MSSGAAVEVSFDKVCFDRAGLGSRGKLRLGKVLPGLVRQLR